MGEEDKYFDVQKVQNGLLRELGIIWTFLKTGYITNTWKQDNSSKLQIFKNGCGG